MTIPSVQRKKANASLTAKSSFRGSSDKNGPKVAWFAGRNFAVLMVTPMLQMERASECVRLLPTRTMKSIGAVTIFAAMAAGLAGCQTTGQDSARWEVQAPTPVSGRQSAYGAWKPAGVQLNAADRGRDALVAPEYYYGPEGAVAQPAGRSGVTTNESGDTVSLNFVETGILEVVDVVMGKTLELNYVIDPRVQGTVTARTSKPIARSAVLAMLENILALNGAALVETKGVYHIVPVGAVASLPKVVVTPSRRPQRQGIGTHVIPLEFASVASVQAIVAAQVSPGFQLAVDPARNILIYTGPAQEAQAIADMVSVLDIDVLAGKSFALFPVESSDAKEVITELEAVFASDAVGTPSGVMRFLPVERLNAVLAISSRSAHLKEAGKWVARLDRADTGAGKQVFVYYAKNGPANDLAELLNQVFGDEASGVEEAGSRAAVAPGSEPVELISPRAQSNPNEPDNPEAPIVTAALAGRTPSADIRRNSGDNGIRFVANERNNAVVITATAKQYRLIESTLRKLDILPLQVLIEATIAEVTLNDDLEYGLQWAFEKGDFSTSLSDNLAGAITPSFPGFNMVLDSSNVKVVLSALSEVTDVKVISSPQLMVLDNQSARLQVGDQVPIAKQSAVSTIDPDAPIVNAIEYFDTGVILDVTSRINTGGQVTLEVGMEVSDAVETETSGINSPTIQQRSINSIVAVQSGETVALGGLIRGGSELSVSGVPVLKDIPILGNLFKKNVQSGNRTELLVLITPRVVRGPAQAREVTHELARRLTGLRDVVATGL